MHIAGYQKTSTIDYPGHLACVVFTRGCNFRCGYCHNHALIPRGVKQTADLENEITGYLTSAKGWIDAVVLTGGEPTLQPNLKSFVLKIKSLDYKIKLDTNGSHPDILHTLLNEKLVDFVAMDIKAPLVAASYERVIGRSIPDITDRIRESIGLIVASGCAHEFRTTVARELLTPAEIVEIATLLKGSNAFTLQHFSPEHVADSAFQTFRPYETHELQVLEPHICRYTDRMRII